MIISSSVSCGGMDRGHRHSLWSIERPATSLIAPSKRRASLVEWAIGVISSSCCSLKSVWMVGWKLREPSWLGWAVWAKCPSVVTRRFSLSRPKVAWRIGLDVSSFCSNWLIVIVSPSYGSYFSLLQTEKESKFPLRFYKNSELLF